MQVLVTSEHRFERTPDGSVWTANVNAYSFWSRYLDVFDHVRVLGRVRDVNEAKPRWIRADGPRVEFHAIPYFVGPAEYILHYRAVNSAIDSALLGCEAVIMRVPSLLSHRVSAFLDKRRRPFALEVVGDPYDVFSPRGVRHPARAVFRLWFSSILRKQCIKAKAVAYVTTCTLQKRYPCAAHMTGVSDVTLPDDAFTITYSSVELTSEQVLPFGRDRATKQGRATLVFVGSLSQLYKAPDVLLQAVAKVFRNGFDLQLKLVGDGRYRGMLEGLALELGIADRCHFLGELPGGAAVRNVLDDADIFVLPSHVEGLPRAIIEAMARGLPCIGSTAGGIPELLASEDLVEPGDVNGLAALIQDVVTDPARQREMSARNMAESRIYADELLKSRRVAFYRRVESVTALYLQRKGQQSKQGEQAHLSHANESSSLTGPTGI